MHGSDQDASFIYPLARRCPAAATRSSTTWRQGRLAHVGVAGGAGSYDITLEAYRPGSQGAKPVQTLFLDFDGARVNTGIWGGPGYVTLSPFAGVPRRWGIPAGRRTR